MEHITYKTQGVCSRQIDLDIENDVIVDAKFTGGCSGNTQGVAALVKGMKVEDAISRMPNVQRYDCWHTGLLSAEKLKSLQDAMEKLASLLK